MQPSSGGLKARPVENYIASAIFFISNLFFVIRYTNRADFTGGFIMASAVLLYALFLAFIVCRAARIRISDKTVAVCLALYTTGCLTLMHFLPVDSFMIDRWAIITMFCDAVDRGVYPYSVAMDSGNMAGASPIYFAISYPFYKIGMFELMPLSVPWLWWFGFRRYVARDVRLTGLIALLTSPIFNYEILTRSTLLFNSILVAIFCLHLGNIHRWDTRRIIVNAIIGGLLLNTRTTYIVPYIIIWLSAVCTHRKPGKPLLWGIVAAAVYLSVFVIMGVIWGFDALMDSNPLTVQNRSLYPEWIMVMLIIMSVAAGIFSRPKRAMFVSGVVLFVATCFYDGVMIDHYGIYQAFILTRADLTYFCFCIPFILPSLALTHTGHEHR